MANTFAEYTNLSLNILKFIDDPRQIIDTKLALFNEVLNGHALEYDSVLFIGFSPWCFSKKFKKIFITCLTDAAAEYLDENDVEYTRLSYTDIINGEEAFECVVALDEFTTFVATEAEQRALVELISECTDKLLITTLRDYKNADFKQKEFSSPEPLVCCGEHTAKIITEYHNYNFSPADRYAWKCKVYELTGDEMIYHGGFMRRAMFFKQLANFTSEVGAKHFGVYKTSMYQSLSRRDNEYIIGIEF